MEKTIKEIVKVEDVRHEFYCDECNEYLGVSYEFDDGWYKELGDFKMNYYVDDCWFSLRKCLCDKCRREFVNKFRKILFDIGFKVE